MEKYFLEQFLSFWKELRLFRVSSIVLLLITAPFVSKLTALIKEFADWFLPSIPIVKSLFPVNHDYIPVLTSTEIKLLIWFLLFLIFRCVIDLLYNLLLVIESNRQQKIVYEFESQDEKGLKKLDKKISEEWLVQGYPHLSREGFVITNTNSGCLIKPSILFNNNFLNIWSGQKIWKNFKATVHVRYTKQQDSNFKLLLGIVFRAQSHDDYFMVELWSKEKSIMMRPHVRVSGNWDAPILDDDNNLLMLEKETDNFTYILELKDNVLTITVNGGKEKQLVWVLPTNYEINLIQHNEAVNANKGVSKGAVLKIPFRDKTGMFGFRNYGNEIAIVEKLEIGPLSKHSDSIQ